MGWTLGDVLALDRDTYVELVRWAFPLDDDADERM